MSQPIRGQHLRVGGIVGRVLFSANASIYGHRRTIQIDVEAETICRLAECIRGCPHVYEDPRTGERPATIEAALADKRFLPTWIGHAIWHIENPDRLMPCLESDGKTIDTAVISALPAKVE